MMKRVLLAILMSVFLLAIVAAPTSETGPAQAAGSVSYTFYCNALVVSGTSDQYAVQADVIVRWSGFPGTLRATSGPLVLGGGTQSFELFAPISPILTGAAPAPFGPLDPDNMEQFLWIYGMDAGMNPTEDYVITGDVCSGVLAGCDASLDIPATAVGGSFVADAPVYWAPEAGASIDVTITAGNTTRVLGVDASGAYYKILWECQFVWVPVGTLGPNFDEVWNGAPLPTGVVE